MVKKNTNEHDYYKPLRAFLTYHFGKTAGNETKLANVLHYCKTNWARIEKTPRQILTSRLRPSNPISAPELGAISN